jgi:hypothetical protein
VPRIHNKNIPKIFFNLNEIFFFDNPLFHTTLEEKKPPFILGVLENITLPFGELDYWEVSNENPCMMIMPWDVYNVMFIK